MVSSTDCRYAFQIEIPAVNAVVIKTIGFAINVAQSPFNAPLNVTVVAVAAPSAVANPIVDNFAAACASLSPVLCKICIL